MPRWADTLLFSSLVIITLVQGQQERPNFVFILADDLGFNDIGYTNPEVITPNLDALAASGIILDRNYVQPVCTPTRSSLMTGRYPYKIGRQGVLPILPNQPTGLTLDHKLLPQHLQQSGYATHMIGKWHLGSCKTDFLPLNRGFDSFFGFWSAAIDYYDKTVPGGLGGSSCYDLFSNETIYEDRETYSIELHAEKAIEVISSHDPSNPLFLYLALQSPHTPLQVPERFEDMYPGVRGPRKTYLGMVTAMDEAIGLVIEALKSKGLYENSIIVFSSDNGGMPLTGGASNDPLRGMKGNLYEGGVRVPGLVHAPKYIQNSGSIYGNLLHVTDWFPTILKMAQVDDYDSIVTGIDGVDQSSAIFGPSQKEQPRKIVVNELSTINLGHFRGAFQIDGGWKLVLNPAGTILFNRYELYNVLDDPSESNDLSDVYPELFEEMKLMMDELFEEMVPEDNPDSLDVDVCDENGNIRTGWC